jgi:hypothetical protein
MARALVEASPRLDVRRALRIARGGLHRCRPVLGSTVPLEALVTFSAATWTLEARVRLAGDHGTAEVNGRPAELEAEPMPLGGVRWWARCPRCSRRCAVLHLCRSGLACRVCLGLAYESTRAGDAQRAAQLEARTLGRLRATPGLELPRRPPRMRRATYERTARRVAGLRARADAAAVALGAA